MSWDAQVLWSGLTPDDAGLVTAVVQHHQTGQILMVGHMSREALAATLENRRVTFWSRSRRTLWEKGVSSGNHLDLKGIRVDCDGDALLVQAAPQGPTCHTGATSCFFKQAVAAEGSTVRDLPGLPEDDGPAPVPAAVLEHVLRVIEARKSGLGMTNPEGKSYVRSLLDRGASGIGEKLREEADELASALETESDERVANETADLLFHALVGLALRDMDLQALADVLAGRFGVSGIDEKASR